MTKKDEIAFSYVPPISPEHRKFEEKKTYEMCGIESELDEI